MNAPFLELTAVHQHERQRYVVCLFSFCFYFQPLMVTSPFVLMPITVHHRRTHWQRYVTAAHGGAMGDTMGSSAWRHDGQHHGQQLTAVRQAMSPALGNEFGNAHWTGVSLEPAVMLLLL